HNERNALCCSLAGDLLLGGRGEDKVEGFGETENHAFNTESETLIREERRGEERRGEERRGEEKKERTDKKRREERTRKRTEKRREEERREEKREEITHCDPRDRTEKKSIPNTRASSAVRGTMSSFSST